MKAWRLATRNWIRGLRAGRLTVLVVALTVAVAAITSVSAQTGIHHAKPARCCLNSDGARSNWIKG